MGTCTFTDGQWVGMGHGDPMEVVERWGSWRSFPNSVILGFCVLGARRFHEEPQLGLGSVGGVGGKEGGGGGGRLGKPLKVTTLSSLAEQHKEPLVSRRR